MEPQITIAIVAVIVSSMSTIIQKLVRDQEKVDEIKERMDELKKQSKENPEDKGTQKEMLSLSKKMMKQNFKPMLYTMIPIFAVIIWLRGRYEGAGVVAELPILNIGLTWLWWYILISIIVSLTLEGIYKTYRKKNKEE